MKQACVRFFNQYGSMSHEEEIDLPNDVDYATVEIGSSRSRHAGTGFQTVSGQTGETMGRLLDLARAVDEALLTRIAELQAGILQAVTALREASSWPDDARQVASRLEELISAVGSK